MNDLINILAYSEDSPMIFTNFIFWVFFGLLLAVYSFVYKKHVLRNSFLFLVSLYFYYKSGGYFFSLLIISIIIDYSMGLLIASGKTKLKKQFYMFISVMVNIGVLVYFKYSYFFVDITNSLFHTNFQVVNLLSLWTNQLSGSNFDVSSIILPVGISFYTFQSLSYTIDVYRDKIKPIKNIIDYGFFVTFFPQLVAGPIVRATEFLPQLYEDYKLTKQEMGHAIFLILNGLMKKMLISDFISSNFVDRIFDAPGSYSGFENLMAVYGYSIQIYCDFSGYTDMAIGLALLLGFKLPINFNSPYKAQNITDFWRRWHISLSTWLRDYLYISIGGNKNGKIRTYINLMITMILGGLWHGASVRFVIWGTLHGVGLALHKVWLEISPFTKSKTAKKSKTMHFLGILVTFHFVAFTWIFFRATDMKSVGEMLSQITGNFNIVIIPEVINSYLNIFSLILFAFIIHWLPESIKENYRGWFIKTSTFAKVLIIVIVVIIVYQAKTTDIQPFIYFQF